MSPASVCSSAMITPCTCGAMVEVRLSFSFGAVTHMYNLRRGSKCHLLAFAFGCTSVTGTRLAVACEDDTGLAFTLWPSELVVSSTRTCMLYGTSIKVTPSLCNNCQRSNCDCTRAELRLGTGEETIPQQLRHSGLQPQPVASSFDPCRARSMSGLG